jgi:phage terminase large subunit-like protein
MNDLETEMIRFPRGKHDDLIDAMQMLYSMYELTPNVNIQKRSIEIKYNQF